MNDKIELLRKRITLVKGHVYVAVPVEELIELVNQYDQLTSDCQEIRHKLDKCLAKSLRQESQLRFKPGVKENPMIVLHRR